MAFIDYGAIAFKNGKCIQNDYFGDMLEMVGWEDEEERIRQIVNDAKVKFGNEFI